MNFRAFAAALSTTLLLAACGGGGSSVESRSEIRSTTTGQELLDLKAARDSGAMTEDEYETQREKILERE
jgi:hypothetical protein